MASKTDLYNTIRDTAVNHMRAYDSPDPWSFDKIWQYRTDDAVQYLYPNLPSPFDAGLTKEGFRSAMQFFAPVLESSRFELNDICVDTTKRTATLFLTGHFDLKAVEGQPAEKDFEAQYMWLCYMDETGRKIRRIDEFMDKEKLMGDVRVRAEKMMASH